MHESASAVSATESAPTPESDGTVSPPPGPAGPSGALAALCLIARLHQVAAEPAHLAHQLGWSPSHRPTPSDLILAAKQIGLKARLSRSSANRLALVPLPALALLRDPGGEPRVVVLAQCDGQRVLFQDPSESIQGGRPVRSPWPVPTSRSPPARSRPARWPPNG